MSEGCVSRIWKVDQEDIEMFSEKKMELAPIQTPEESE
jgi:hypothetical protein